jgi:Amt family ammonium transporter
MKFSSYLVFALLWTTVVYDPVCHWVWGAGGWLKQMGALDFAGGIVVHATSGFSALAAALYIGGRKGFLREPMPPHDLPLTVLGAGLLWFGWFGFNAGSALTSGELAAMAFVTTHTAAVAATLTWIFAEWVHRGKPTMFGAATGAIAGLATITPAAGFVGPMAALAIGVGAGLLCYTALNAKTRFRYDDSLDAFGVHGVGGTLGTVMAGLFATVAVNPAGANGLFFGNAGQLAVQSQAVLIVAAYSFIVTLVLFKVIDMIMGIRVHADMETEGLDISQHGEAGYTH